MLVKNQITKFLFGAVILLICTFTYFACNKGESSNSHFLQQPASAVAASENGVHYVFDNKVTSQVLLSSSDRLLSGYQSSSDYKNLPANILSQVKNQKPTQINYDAAKVLIMTYNLSRVNSSVVYNTLVVYEYNNKYLSVIVKNEKLPNGFYHISFTDLAGAPYFDFQVNKQSKFGKYHSTRSIPFETIAPRSTTSLQQQQPTCMQSTSTFSDCMSCAISECVDDWLCAVGCGLESAGCVTVWTVACIAD